MSTKIATLVGLGMAFHVTIVYTNSSGSSFGVSSGPSVHGALQTPGSALRAIVDAALERPSDFGFLISDPANGHPFKRTSRDDYYTQDLGGETFPSYPVLTGKDLSATWAIILNSYEEMSSLHLTYSPITQNSNSMAGTALRQAGIAIPSSFGTRFSPGLFNDLTLAPHHTEVTQHVQILKSGGQD